MGEYSELKLDIVAGNEEEYRKVAESLSRRSASLGLNFVYKLLTDKVYTDDKGNQRVPTIARYELPKMGAYELIATLEIYENKPLVKVVNREYTKQIKESISKLDSECHHCKQKRNRRYLYLLWDSKNKRVLQLGKSCSKSYVGHGNVDKLYKYVQDLSNVEEKDFMRNYGNHSLYLNSQTILQLTLKELEESYDNYVYMDYDKSNKVLGNILQVYFDLQRGEITEDELALVSILPLQRKVNNILAKKGQDILNDEYNLLQIMKDKYIRADKVYMLTRYVTKLVNDYVNGYGFGVGIHEAKSVVNATFNHLEGNEFDKSKGGTLHKVVDILTNNGRVGNVELKPGLEEDREKWANHIRELDEDYKEDIAYYLSENSVSGYDVKKIVNSIGQFKTVKGAHVGEVGDRIKVPVYLIKMANTTIPSYSGYGEDTLYIYTFKDNEDNIYTWFTSKDYETIIHEIGNGEDYDKKEVYISAKIKQHKSFNGVPQNIVNYVKIV